MSKLLEDPKIAALVEKAETRARKEATKYALDAVKEALAENKDVEDKTIKRHVAAVLKGVTDQIKSPF